MHRDLRKFMLNTRRFNLGAFAESGLGASVDPEADRE